MEVRIEERVVYSERHPIAIMTLKNTGAVPVAVSRTFGFGAYAWFGLRIKAADGSTVHYPVEADLFEEPHYSCLHPGKSVVLDVDLLRWRIEVQGHQPWEEEYGFVLPPGRYELQAAYVDAPPRETKRCTPATESALSDWVEFEIRNEAGSRE